MEYGKMLLLILLFLFSIFLYPEMETAIAGVATTQPLQAFIERLPLIWLGTILVLMTYTVVEGVKE